MVEATSKSEVSERGGEGVYCVVKIVTKCKMSEGGWEKVVNFLIESPFKLKCSKRRRKVMNGVIK